VSPLRPAKAEPLLLAIEVNAYRISVRPCGPWLSRAEVPTSSTAAIPVRTSTTAGMTRMARPASLTSRAWTFLPSHSGVRPTIRPATNTASSTNTSRLYSPDPTPPGETSPSSIWAVGTSPPAAV
jgi:hypothetical protein